MRPTRPRRPAAPGASSGIEVQLSRREIDSLKQAQDIVRWLLAKTACGWSHAALDPTQWARWGERLEVLYLEAREQKRAETTVVLLTKSDAALFRHFVALVEAIEPDAFSGLASEFRQLGAAIGAAPGRPCQRGRRSPLAET